MGISHLPRPEKGKSMYIILASIIGALIGSVIGLTIAKAYIKYEEYKEENNHL